VVLLVDLNGTPIAIDASYAVHSVMPSKTKDGPDAGYW
jgi:hypothetical protein